MFHAIFLILFLFIGLPAGAIYYYVTQRRIRKSRKNALAAKAREEKELQYRLEQDELERKRRLKLQEDRKSVV